MIRRYIEEVVNTGDVARLTEFIATNYIEVRDNKKCGADRKDRLSYAGVVPEHLSPFHPVVDLLDQRLYRQAGDRQML